MEKSGNWSEKLRKYCNVSKRAGTRSTSATRKFKSNEQNEQIIDVKVVSKKNKNVYYLTTRKGHPTSIFSPSQHVVAKSSSDEKKDRPSKSTTQTMKECS